MSRTNEFVRAVVMMARMREVPHHYPMKRLHDAARLRSHRGSSTRGGTRADD